jgi:hypothetical protein
MRFSDQYSEDAYARWVLKDAQIRAMARRQLALSIPVAVAGAFVVIVSTLSFGRAASQSYDQRAPISAPASSHSTMLCSTSSRGANA